MTKYVSAGLDARCAAGPHLCGTRGLATAPVEGVLHPKQPTKWNVLMETMQLFHDDTLANAFSCKGRSAEHGLLTNASSCSIH